MDRRKFIIGIAQKFGLIGLLSIGIKPVEAGMVLESIGGAAPATCDNPEDFGFGGSGGYTGVSNSWYKHNSNAVFTCPGTGSRDICFLSVTGQMGSSSAGVKMAIYTQDLNTLLADTPIAKTFTVSAWTILQWERAELNIYGTVTGGQNYVLVVTGDSSNAELNRTTVTSGDFKLNNNADYMSGFPSTLPTGNSDSTLSMRVLCGVD